MKTNNIRVACRVRPLNKRELISNDQICISQISNQQLQYYDKDEKFTFDHVYSENAQQNQIYQETASPVIDSVLQGFNGTIFAYGQTSSGKTHTMNGTDITCEINKGIIPRAINHIFDSISNSSEQIEFRLKVSLIEIYLEQIQDLLNLDKRNIKIRQNKQRGIYLEDVTEVYVSSDEEIYQLLDQANCNRSVNATNMNEKSSRSHLIFIMQITQNNLVDLSASTGKLFLIDLAGCEKISQTGATGRVLEEAKKINTSLSCLGLVINQIVEKSQFISYRDSKLTRLLQDSLGGNSLTTLIITCSPSIQNDQETLSTLRFGMRVKKIVNNPKINKEPTIGELQALIAQKDITIEKLREQISDLEDIVDNLKSQTDLVQNIEYFSSQKIQIPKYIAENSQELDTIFESIRKKQKKEITDFIFKNDMEKYVTFSLDDFEISDILQLIKKKQLDFENQSEQQNQTKIINQSDENVKLDQIEQTQSLDNSESEDYVDQSQFCSYIQKQVHQGQIQLESISNLEDQFSQQQFKNSINFDKQYKQDQFKNLSQINNQEKSQLLQTSQKFDVEFKQHYRSKQPNQLNISQINANSQLKMNNQWKSQQNQSNMSKSCVNSIKINQSNINQLNFNNEYEQKLNYQSQSGWNDQYQYPENDFYKMSLKYQQYSNKSNQKKIDLSCTSNQSFQFNPLSPSNRNPSNFNTKFFSNQKARGDNKHLYMENQYLQVQVQSLSQENEQIINRLSFLMSQGQEMENLVREAQIKQEKQIDINENLANQVTIIQNELETSQNENTNLKQKLSIFEQNQPSQQQSIQLKQLQQQVQYANQEINDLKILQQKNDIQYQTLNQNYLSLVNQQHPDMKSVQLRLEQIIKQNEQKKLEQIKQTMQQDIKQKQQKIMQIELQLDSQKQQNHQLEYKLIQEKKEKNEVNSHSGNIHQLKEINKNLIKQVSNLKIDNQVLNKKLQRKTENLDTLDKTLSSVQSQLQQYKNNFIQNIPQLDTYKSVEISRDQFNYNKNNTRIVKQIKGGKK